MERQIWCKEFWLIQQKQYVSNTKEYQYKNSGLIFLYLHRQPRMLEKKSMFGQFQLQKDSCLC